MRIIIETDGKEALTLAQEDGAQQGTAQTAGEPEAIDGGAPPGDLLEALRSESGGDTPNLESQLSDDVDDGGEAPSWLVDALESAQSKAFEDPSEE